MVVNVAVPAAPVCVNVWLNGASTVPVVTPGFVTVIVGHTVTKPYDVAPEQPDASVAVTTIGNVPPCVGVPERTPAANVIPAGRAPVSASVYGDVPPLGVNVTGPYGEPTGPEGRVGGSTVIATPLHVTVTT